VNNRRVARRRSGSDELLGGQAVGARSEERLAVEREQTHVSQAADRRGAGDFVEQRDLAEVIGPREGPAEPLSRLHGRGSLEQHIEAVARFPLPNHVVAGAHRVPVAYRLHRLERALLEAGQ
jgi:hypothetical protein